MAMNKDAKHINPNDGCWKWIAECFAVGMAGVVLGYVALLAFQRWPFLWFPMGVMALFFWFGAVISLLVILMSLYVHFKCVRTLRKLPPDTIKSFDLYNNYYQPNQNNQSNED